MEKRERMKEEGRPQAGARTGHETGKSNGQGEWQNPGMVRRTNREGPREMTKKTMWDS